MIPDWHIQVKKIISYLMSFLGGNLEGGSKMLGNSPQTAYQWDGLPIGADIEYKLDDYMPTYFTPATSFGVCMR